MGVRFVNNFNAPIAASLSNTDTTIPLASGFGAVLTAKLGTPLGSTDYIYATLVNAANDIEIVKVTAISGDDLTVVRGVDNTTARSWVVGDRISFRPNAAALTDALDVEAAINAIKGAPNGLATLDGATKVPIAQLYAGVANGLASLDSTTRVPAAQLGAGTADATTFLRGDRTWATVSVSPNGAFRSVQLFATPGSFTYTKPSGLVRAKITVVGGGGGGGGGHCYEGCHGGSGGGGGGSAILYIEGGSIGATVPVTVGAGGAPGSGGNGGNGGTSSFGALVSATGGAGGKHILSGADGGVGGMGSNGTINIRGRAGNSGSSSFGGTGGVSIFASGAGSGGLGGFQLTNASSGSHGIVIVEEFF